MQLSAVTAGALALPGHAVADHESEKATELYDFIRNHVEGDYVIQTLVLFESEAGFDALEDLGLEQDIGDDETEPVDIEQTTDPQPAAHIGVTPFQASDVLELDEIEQVEFSPGANPFWKLDNYEDGVFPSVEESIEYISFDEAVEGLRYLEDQHSDRLNIFRVGETPGYHNLLEGETDPQDMWFGELTNNIEDSDSFKEKRKCVFSISIHSDEPYGREGFLRLVEQTLVRDEPDMDKWLDDIVVVFVLTNPDGWVRREPQYIGVENEFGRENAAGVDQNRGFPTEGWIDPDHYPGEAWGANLEDDQPTEIDDDVPEDILDHVPDTLAVTNHLRTYNNIETVADLHGMGWSEEPVESRPLYYTLTQNSNQFDHQELHDADEMTRVVGEYVREELGPIEDHRDALFDGVERFAQDDDELEAEDVAPELIFRDGSSVDTLGYTTTGGFRSFVGGLQEFSGLGVKGNTVEFLQYSGEGRMDYRHDFTNLAVDTYQAVVRGYIDHGTSNVEATIETDGRSTAYVASETLTRSSDDLVFADTEQTFTSSSSTLESDETDVVSFDVSGDAGQISVTVEHDGPVTATLIDPDGEAVETYESTEEMEREAEWNVTNPAAGEWSVDIENRSDDENEVTVSSQQLLLEENEEDVDGVLAPDPEEVLGFTQAEYEVTPMQYFEDNAEFFADADLDIVSVDDVTDGALDDGDAYDNVVINHDEPADDQQCLDQLDEFVDTGGNLVLTDRGVQLLGHLESDLAAGVADDDIESIERQFALLDDDPDEDDPDDELPSDGKNLDHRLMEGIRPVQREMWNVAGLGYASPNIEAPMTLVDADAFEGAGGTVAATTDHQVSVGALEHDGEETGIHVISSVLPPALQNNLHPFGMVNYGLELLGHQVLMNALGYDQQRIVDGEEIDVWDNPEERDAEP
ncbi:M14 family zinc carboxypeptidase [Halalkalicoccus tibetensis]|uniref:M14 family zinc carboxypeptidase n=1 Tax=Halalkalicoccus tibetensis TaxID=175632 RepID=A0ABD5V743_9EURY